MGNFSAWQGLRAAPARDVTPLLVDLAGGLEAAEALIEAERPEQIDLRHGERRLALTYLDPGAEPWRGHHLRPFLMNHCARPWLEQRMQPGGPASGRSDIGPSDTGFSEAERNAASRGLRHVAPHLNAATAPFVWHEQYDQWRKLAELQDQTGQPSA